MLIQWIFDVLIPSLHLAFEYQGRQHYEFTFHGTPEAQQLRDQAKRAACVMAGITLIEIPYWWDNKKDSLMASIHAARPDVIGVVAASPIPPEKLYGTTIDQTFIAQHAAKWCE